MTDLIIDCDPGVDDAIALFLALASPELRVLAVTTVGGNVGADLTARNTRLICEMAGRGDIPVHAGAALPLVRPPIDASTFHGETGLGSLTIFEPSARVAPGHAANAIVSIVMAQPPGTVTIAVLGPMTNLALAMRLEPAIVGRIARVVSMGGSTTGGNITAFAEYNVYADPHAAQIVFSSGCLCVALGLDVTLQVRNAPHRIEALRQLHRPDADAVAQLMTFSNKVEVEIARGVVAPLHDPCVIAYILAPELFQTQPCSVHVKIEDAPDQGQTTLDHNANADVEWGVGVDSEGVFNLLQDRLSRP